MNIPNRKEFEDAIYQRHTPRVHNRVKTASVAVAGLGGLGSNIALALARTGVGRLHLVDFDKVELSNINRQMYFINHLGMNKTDALKELIYQINPYIKVDVDTVKVEQSNVLELFKREEYICEAFDDPVSKALLVNSILENRGDAYIVAASGMAGYDSSNLIKTKKISKKFYICGDLINESKPGMGLMAPRVNICAAHQANMILRLILGIEEE